MPLLLVAGLLAGQSDASQDAASENPISLARALLAEAVDLEQPRARRDAARELAKREDIELEHWLEAARSFGDFDALEAGAREDQVELFVDGKRERTSLSWYVPKSYRPDQPAGLIVAVHGAGGSGKHELATFAPIAEALGMLVLAPSEAGPNLGYAFSERERQVTLAALRWLRRRANIDENRVHLTGVSRGGHACFDLARHPEAWASVVPRIGGPALLVTEGRNNIRLAVNFSHLPVRVLQGMGDQDKLLLNQELALDRLRAAGGDALRIEFAEHGHSYDRQAFDWAGFYEGAVRDPQATRLTLAAAREGEGQLLWLGIDRFGKEVKEDFTLRVDPHDWNRWDHADRARFMQAEADRRTARVDARFLGVGRFELETQGVSRLQLLLPNEMLGERGAVEAQWKGKQRKKKLKPSARVLLEHFVEHFDRSFLPVAAWELR